MLGLLLQCSSAQDTFAWADNCAAHQHAAPLSTRALWAWLQHSTAGAVPVTAAFQQNCETHDCAICLHAHFAQLWLASIKANLAKHTG